MTHKVLFNRLVRGAKNAAEKALETAPEKPREIKDRKGKVIDVIDAGVAGMAWVAFPGNTAFGRWAKRHNVAKPGHPRGLMVMVKPDDVETPVIKKVAYAETYAEVLRSAGIQAKAHTSIHRSL